MSPEDLLALSDLQVAETVRESVRGDPEGELRERAAQLLVSGADAFPVGFWNAALPLGPAPLADPEGFLDEAARFFGERGRGYTVWTRAHLDAPLVEACAHRGLQAMPASPGMVLEAPAPEPPLPPARFVFAETEETLRDFVEVSARAWEPVGLPPASVRGSFERVGVRVRPHVLVVVAYDAGLPAATAMAILSHGVAGLYWVGTVPEARKRGLGEACTRLVGNAAFARGARACFLQASQQGEPIYRRMGYREFTRYGWHVALPGAGKR